MPDTKLFAVTGNPILHSRSPQLFNSLFHSMGIDAVYTRLAASSAEEAMKTAKAIQLCGLNVTSPLKKDIIRYLDRIDKHASKINAVNCIVMEEYEYIGYNTDFIGAITALKKNGFFPKNKKTVVIGAGGAACAAAYGLLESQAKKVTILNRTYERAKNISLRLGCDAAPLSKTNEMLKHTELAIFCIPSSPLTIDPSLLKPGITVLDANYKNPTFMYDIQNKGGRVINGLEWLYYQALPSFQLFTGQKILNSFRKNILQDLLIKKPADKSNIALVGFMGSGKTKIGQFLAERMKLGFVDTDILIEKSFRATIPEIFKKRGENAFRKIEQSVIAEQIPNSSGNVFSLGGGAVLNEENRMNIKQNCYVIWLWSSAQAAIKRMDVSSRPLLNISNPEMRAERILKSRIPLYAEVSDLIVNTETGTTKAIAERIKNEMDQILKD